MLNSHAIDENGVLRNPTEKELTEVSKKRFYYSETSYFLPPYLGAWKYRSSKEMIRVADAIDAKKNALRTRKVDASKRDSEERHNDYHFYKQTQQHNKETKGHKKYLGGFSAI